MRDGSNLDFEKLRDKAGQVPARGYDLYLTSSSRWLGLGFADLNTTDQMMPSNVCLVGSITGNSVSFSDEPATTGGGVGGSSGTGGSSDMGYSWGSGSSTTPSLDHGPYPSPSDPNLVCQRDGRTWDYNSCRSKSSVPAGLCGQYHPVMCDYYGAHLGSANPVPSGWPCTVIDTGNDAGISVEEDAGF
jgi:hypothetical protein